MATLSCPSVKFPELTIVDFRKWSGKDTYQTCESKLYNSNSKLYCCLGFACVSAGIDQREILNVSDPVSLFWDKNIRLLKMIQSTKRADGTAFCICAVHYNDSASYSPAERIDLLYELFKKNKVSIAFSHVPKRVRDKVKNKEALKKH
jgi:hypothetical protein